MIAVLANVQFAGKLRRYVLIVFLPIIGCKEHQQYSIARLSIDNSESIYDSIADSTTTIQSSIELRDTNHFWKSVIDSILATGLNLQTVPMLSSDTFIEVEIGANGGFIFNSALICESTFIVHYYDSAENRPKYFLPSAPTIEVIRARIRMLTHDLPPFTVWHRSPGNSIIPSGASECDSAIKFTECIQTMIDRCVPNDARIY